MKIKKILSVALTTALIGSSAAVAVSAKTDTPDNIYKYVALGDSITAGFGLTSEGDNYIDKFSSERALVLTEDLIADPIKEAYPALFGEYLDKKGSELDIETSTVNLAACAYRADDIAKTILDETYVSRQAIGMLSMAKNSNLEALNQYHDIMVKYLSDADLVSIQLGGNDVLLGLFRDISAENNPILTAISKALSSILIGASSEEALEAAYNYLEQNKDSITLETVVDAVRFISSVKEKMGDSVADAAQKVNDVVSAVRKINSNADIAILGMYDPYGNSLEYDGQVRDFCNVSQNILSRVIKDIIDIDIDVEFTKPENVTEKEANDKIKVISGAVVKIDTIVKLDIVKRSHKEQLERLLSIVTDEIAYPMQYMLSGKTVGKLMQALNTELVDVADATGSEYVDVYNISNELGLDPHPTAKGHREIADIMSDALADVVTDGMGADKVIEPLENVSTISAETIKLGEKIKVRGVAEGGTGDYEYAFYYKKAASEKWARVHDFSSVRAVNIVPASATKYDILVKIKDSAGNVVSKTFELSVTKK